ncbi:hypothetical protein DY000_02032628 [Brassica cretica]|uniref:Uncharacterized protein n=1 Tax=Brassica cretica TaxID=69181 RepID=A0ABQ7DK57_BRACR|nr:hypothetical protein DY000_02032628 [Brassica cretica]
MDGSRGMKLLQRRSHNNYTTDGRIQRHEASSKNITEQLQYSFMSTRIGCGSKTVFILSVFHKEIAEFNVEEGRGKKPVELSDFKTVWSIKKQYLDMKERLSKIKLLDSLIGKQGPLADYEEALKKKLVDELIALDDEGTTRPPGVKASKGRGKKPVELSDFKTVWSIKKQYLDMKERLSKIKLLDSLIGKQGPLADYEEALKKKLVDELMSN